jgi:hypothetical protein
VEADTNDRKQTKGSNLYPDAYQGHPFTEIELMRRIVVCWQCCGYNRSTDSLKKERYDIETDEDGRDETS